MRCATSSRATTSRFAGTIRAIPKRAWDCRRRRSRTRRFRSYVCRWNEADDADVPRSGDRLGLQTTPSGGIYDVAIVGGGPVGPRRGGVRRIGRVANDPDRARRAGRAGRDVIADRELPRIPDGRFRRRTGRARAVAGEALRRRDSRREARGGRSRIDDGASRAVVLDDGERIGVKTIVLATGVTWRSLEIPGAERLVGRGVYYGAARTEALGHARPRHLPDRRRQLGRPGRDVLRRLCAHGHAARAGPVTRGEHVALPDRTAGDERRTSRSRRAARW